MVCAGVIKPIKVRSNVFQNIVLYPASVESRGLSANSRYFSFYAINRFSFLFLFG